MTRRALVLAGGGVRGAFQVGMVRELVKTRDFQIIRGVSVGAINGAFLAQASGDGDSHAALKQEAVGLETVWHRIGVEVGKVAQAAGAMDSLARMEAMGDILKKLIDTAIKPDRLAGSGRDFTAGFVSLVSGRYEEAAANRAGILDLVRASAALPPYFPFVPTGEDLLVDGGYRNITPLASALKAEPAPDEVYVLLTRQITNQGGRLTDCAIEPLPFASDWKPLLSDPQKMYARVAERLTDILMDEIYIEDVKRAIDVNTLARALAALERSPTAGSASELGKAVSRAMRRPPRYVKLFVIAPRQRFNPQAAPGKGDDIAQFDESLIRAAIEHGSEVAADESQWVWHPEREE